MFRFMIRQRRSAAIVTGITAIGLCAAALTGCGTPSADAGDVADQIRSYAEQRLSLEGATVDSVTCDKDLLGEPGASATCTLKVTLAGTTATNVADVTVDSVDGDSAQFTMTPVSWSAPAAFMEEAAARVFARLVQKQRPGGSVDSASCDEDVTATDAVTTRCTVTWSNAAAEQYTQPVDVTVEKSGNIDVQVAPDK